MSECQKCVDNDGLVVIGARKKHYYEGVTTRGRSRHIDGLSNTSKTMKISTSTPNLFPFAVNQRPTTLAACKPSSGSNNRNHKGSASSASKKRTAANRRNANKNYAAGKDDNHFCKSLQ